VPLEASCNEVPCKEDVQKSPCKEDIHQSPCASPISNSNYEVEESRENVIDSLDTRPKTVNFRNNGYSEEIIKLSKQTLHVNEEPQLQSQEEGNIQSRTQRNAEQPLLEKEASFTQEQGVHEPPPSFENALGGKEQPHERRRTDKRQRQSTTKIPKETQPSHKNTSLEQTSESLGVVAKESLHIEKLLGISVTGNEKAAATTIKRMLKQNRQKQN